MRHGVLVAAVAPSVLDLELQLLVDQVMAANAAAQSNEPTVLYCAIARCASCGKHHHAAATGVMFDRCGCGGYLLEVAGAWNPAAGCAGPAALDEVARDE